MNIRKDLERVEGLISRLISIGNEFEKMDSRWTHMKNNEDFDRVYDIEDQQKKSSIEEIYATGREMALFMSEALLLINDDFSRYPTLTSIIEKFKGSWIDSNLNKIKVEGKAAYDELGVNMWSFRQMLGMFQKQIDLAKVVKDTLKLLIESDIYKLENGQPVSKNNPHISISNVSNSNIAVSSENTAQNIEQSGDVFIELIEAIEKSDIKDKAILIDAANDMSESSGTGNFSDSYKSFMALAANHMSIVAPFIPALSALL